VTSSLKGCRIPIVEVQIAVAKVGKYATAESGDTLEVVERPNGGVSVVLADGQTSGHGAKAVSMLVVHKVISLLAEGVRDGAAARAASDALFTDKKGKVISTLNIASVDLHSDTIVLTRNNPCPIYVARGDRADCLDAPSVPLGTSRDVRPVITEIELQTGLTIIIYTDGLVHAGERRGQPMDVCEVIRSLLEDQEPAPQELADSLLAFAVRLDDNRPADDISVLVLKVSPLTGDDVRRLTLRLPIRP
jgi:serine phosphatase RsbU (regulator of sigma subunit)